MGSVAFLPTWLALMVGLMGGVGLPLGVPPLPADPVAARVAPDECLFYLSSAGMAAPDGKSGNQTEQLMAEPEVRQMAAELRRAVTAGLARAMKKQDVPEAISAEKVVQLAMVPLTKPLAIYVSSFEMQPGGPAVRGGVMVNLGDDAAKTEAALADVLKQLLPMPTEAIELGGQKWQRLRLLPGAPVVWGFKDSRLWIGVGQGEIEAMLKRATGEPPAWLAKLHEELPVGRVSTVTYVNLKTILPLAGPQAAETVKALGLGNVTSIRSVTGLDQLVFVNKTLLAIEGPPEGILRLAEAKPLTAADLALIPHDATVALAFKLDPEAAWNVIQEVVGKIDPGMKSGMEATVGQMEQAMGLKLREELLAPLGDTWRVFDSPDEGGALLGLTAVVSVKDAKQAAAAHEKLLGLLRAALKESESRTGKLEDDYHLDTLFRPTRKLDDLEFAGQHIYVYDESAPFGPPVSPSWCLTDKELIVALCPQSIKGYLARGADFQPLGELPAVAKALGGEPGPVKIAYFNAPRMFDVFYPMSLVWAKYAGLMFGQSGIELGPGFLPSARAIRPHLRPTVMSVRRTSAGIEVSERGTLPGVGIASLAPVVVPAMWFSYRVGAVRTGAVEARSAARRMSSMNNLKQIALAILNYESVHGTLPPAYTADKDGKPLLSWRVSLLPYLEGDRLYREFHLDEPWDSEHNKKLLSRMPSVYRSPDSKLAAGEKTNYLAVRGEKTVFSGAKPVALTDITDGTSNTIMTVEVSDASAVPWTKPDDFKYNEKDPLKGLLGLRAEGFLAGFADGSVQLIRRSIDPAALKALFTRDGGEVIPEDALK